MEMLLDEDCPTDFASPYLRSSVLFQSVRFGYLRSARMLVDRGAKIEVVYRATGHNG